MRNFTTNQTRHFYTAGIGETTAEMRTVRQGKDSPVFGLFFMGKNADGLDYRTDIINLKNVVRVTVTKSSQMAIPLLSHTISLNTDEFADVKALEGKTIKLSITIHQLFDYDDDNCITFTVSHKVTAKETADKLFKALADDIEKSMPKADKNFPYFTVKSSAAGIVLTEALQKYVRGKLTGEPVKISVGFGLDSDSFTDDTVMLWGRDKIEKSSEVMPANYALADLEYFALGERSDTRRGFAYPNDVTPTYVIDPKSKTEYDVLSIEYYWCGGAENVQKSPRLIQIAGDTATIKALCDKVLELVGDKKPTVGP